MKVSLVSAYYQNELMTQDFLNNLKDKLPKDCEVILVNAGSEPIENPIITKRIDLPENQSFSNSFNAGIKVAQGEYVCIINNDAFPTSTDWLDKLLLLAKKATAFIVSPQNNKSILINYKILAEAKDYYEVAFYPAVCWLISRECLDKVGLFDEQFIGGNYEDNDYLERVHQTGGKLLLTKDIIINHLGSQTISLLDNQKLMFENYQRFINKWN